jgi:hypothetical protein
MGRCGQIVMGPAGSGKSTYCARLAEHMQAIGRSVQVVNLDPAADNFNYDVRASNPACTSPAPVPGLRAPSEPGLRMPRAASRCPAFRRAPG